MTPIERLRLKAEPAANSYNRGVIDTSLLLAAYDARGREIEAWRAAYEVWNDSKSPNANMRDCSDQATDSAVAAVEGRKHDAD